jgi:uncharacterized membrane protein
MSLILLLLGLLDSWPLTVLVSGIGVLATLLESVMGALFQQRLPWLSNELVNAIQTAVAALLAISAASMLSLVP